MKSKIRKVYIDASQDELPSRAAAAITNSYFMKSMMDPDSLFGLKAPQRKDETKGVPKAVIDIDGGEPSQSEEQIGREFDKLAQTHSLLSLKVSSHRTKIGSASKNLSSRKS
mmetsp:Transcript_29410/g.44489  ORF Transcript_29410/g.44489 Transcript_29410/m.44489 type:complete len:112 (+) Transcript_29410:2051-2386(+)